MPPSTMRAVVLKGDFEVSYIIDAYLIGTTDHRNRSR